MSPTFLPTTTHKNPLNLFFKVFFVVIVAVVSLCVLFYIVGAEPAGESPTPVAPNVATSFDHDQCQYPARSTNPPDGCDNSDPCDPSNVKGGSGECIETPQSQKNQTSQNVVSVQKPVEAVDKLPPMRGK